MKFFKICAEVLVPKFTRAEVRLPENYTILNVYSPFREISSTLEIKISLLTSGGGPGCGSGGGGPRNAGGAGCPGEPGSPSSGSSGSFELIINLKEFES